MVSTKKAVDATVSRFLKDLRGLMTQAVRERVADAVRSARAVPATTDTARASDPTRVVEAVLGRKRGKNVAPELSTEQTEELTDRLLAYIETNPSKSTAQIGAALGVDPESLRVPLRTLLKEDHLVTEGSGANIVYFAR